VPWRLFDISNSLVAVSINCNAVDAEQLSSWLELWLPRISDLNLNPQAIQVRHVLNWGGFVNHSFSVNDGWVRYHLKITNELDSIRRLQRWNNIHNLLEERYRAPELIRWIDFPEIGFAGLLLQHLDGRTANFDRNLALVDQLIALADRLHQDQEIRFRLGAYGLRKSYLDHFIETYIDRFNADLETIAAGQLSFVSSTQLGWIQKEANRLRETASGMRPFHNPAIEAVHGDLNEENVLVTHNSWFVVDWDDLALGDPAVDFAVLLWPMVWQGRDWRDFSLPATGNGFVERIQVCFRAQLLDEVIDPLADYVEAGAVPSQQAAVQVVKRKHHEEALERYRTIWG
jgi:thiamine kinase-like enzyme